MAWCLALPDDRHVLAFDMPQNFLQASGAELSCCSSAWPCALQEKTAEPWLLSTFEHDFYGEEIRLVICAWLRPEAKFGSLEALVEQIHRDADVTRAALQSEPLKGFAGDPFLQPGSGAVAEEGG